MVCNYLRKEGKAPNEYYIAVCDLRSDRRMYQQLDSTSRCMLEMGEPEHCKLKKEYELWKAQNAF